ncbi:MAG: hypothetical protein LBD14_05765 [Puniceicoccales bacterium]|jgi:hypothetical protein|nr:hypothetical protein [Puniceicoccales bacterium]
MKKTPLFLSVVSVARVSSRWFFAVMPVVFSAIFFGACTPTAKPDYVAVVFYEAPSTASALWRDEVVMPVSGLRYHCFKKPEVTIRDFMAVHAVEIGPVGERTPALLVQMSENAARKLFQHTLVAPGSRLFLSINERYVGLHPIHGPVRDGNFYFYVELPSTGPEDFALKLRKLALDLNASILTLRKNPS